MLKKLDPLGRILMHGIAILFVLAFVPQAKADDQVETVPPSDGPVEGRWNPEQGKQLKWLGRLGFFGASSSISEPSSAMTFAFGGGEMHRALHLFGKTYLRVGGQLGYGGITGNTCSTEFVCQDGECTCEGQRGQWTGAGVGWGLSLGVGGGAIFDRPYSLVWLVVRSTSLIGSARGDEGCEDAYGESCEDQLLTNALVAGGAGFDFMHSGPLGCLLGLYGGAPFGDFAARDPVQPMFVLQFAWQFHIYGSAPANERRSPG